MSENTTEFPEGFSLLWSGLRGKLDQKVTPKQAQVICLMCLRWEVKEISEAFGNSPKTIYEHCKRAVDKLGFRETHEMVYSIGKDCEKLFLNL